MAVQLKSSPRPREASSSALAGLTLVVANLLPLALVLAGRGEVGGLVLLYWAENVVIGAYAALRMLTAGEGWSWERLGQAAYFCLHYGGFCFVHGVLLTFLFLSREQQAVIQAVPHWTGIMAFVHRIYLAAEIMGLFSLRGLLLPLLALVVSHGVSFFANYIANGRYLTASVKDNMFAAYSRVFLLHIAILTVGLIALANGSNMPMLVVLIAGKTFIDYALLRSDSR